MDNEAALAYIRKMGGKGNQKMNQVGKELWQSLIKNAITIIVEFIPAKLNTLEEKESRKKDSSE